MGSALRMNGLTVILQAARKLPAVIGEVLARQNIAPAEVTQFLMHQANQNLITRVAKGWRRCVAAVLECFKVWQHVVGIHADCGRRVGARAGTGGVRGFGAGFHWGAVVARCAESPHLAEL